MAKYCVTLSDGRSVDVFAPSAEGARAQASHQERSRIEIAEWRKANGIDPMASWYALKEMVEQYGAPIVEQIMKSQNGPDYKLPDFNLPPPSEERKSVNQKPIALPIDVVKLKD